jgi:hypothetical protein
MNADDHRSTCSELVIAGTIGDGAIRDLDVTVAIETVVPDDEISEILGLYCTRIHTDAGGRFSDGYAVPDETRRRLHGWVMCTVVVQPLVAGAGSYSKVVRWQRSTSDELIRGLNALLSSLSFDHRLSPADHRANDRHDAGSATTRRFV